MQEEQTLWRAIVQADAAAFESLYNRHIARMRQFLTFYLRDNAAAEDMAQESFLDFWKRPDHFDPKRASLKTYLFGIARRKAANWRRGKNREQGTAGESSIRHPETAVLMDDALSQLDVDQRNLLWLREVEGHSYEELAYIFKIPVGTVRSRLSSAREKLRLVWNVRPAKEEQ